MISTAAPTKRNSRAFTLLELLIALLILGIIVAASAPNVSRSFRRLAMKDAASTLACNIRFAQARAIADGMPTRLVFDVANGRYRMEVQSRTVVGGQPAWGSPGGAAASDSPASLATEDFVLPTGVKFDAVHLLAEDGVTAADAMIFYPDGRGGRGSVQISGRDGQFVISLTGRLGQVVTVLSVPANQPDAAVK